MTPKQEDFVAEYLKNGRNASAAYRKAYRVKPGTAETTVWVAASKLLKNAKVAQRVEEAAAKAKEATDMDLAWVLREFAETLRQARVDRNHAACNAAVGGVAKVLGLEKTRVEGGLSVTVIAGMAD